MLSTLVASNDVVKISTTLRSMVGKHDVEAIPDGVVSIDENDLVSVLMGLEKAVSFAGLVCETVPSEIKNPKTSGMGDRITKLSHVTVAVGDKLNYGRIVNGRRDRLAGELGVEPPEDYKVQERKWGMRVPNTPFVIHRGQLYLECLITGVSQTEYKLDGVIVSKDMIAPYLRPKTADTSEERLGVEVIWRDYRLDSIVQVRVDGKIYVVVR